MQSENLLVFYRPGKLHLHALAFERDGVPVAQYGGETLEQLQEKHPDMLLMPFSDACQMIEQAETDKYCRAPVEETADDFNYALNVLPPGKWLRGTATEAFFVSEPLAGGIFTWHVRIGARYWCLNRDGARKPESIISEVATAAGVAL